MVHTHLELEPHVGAPITARPEAEAQRLARAARPRVTEDAAEWTVLVSHSVAKRGWTDVRAGELCKIPGLGPVAPEVAREIASDAFLNGVFFDGTDLRNFKRWSRDIPVDVRAALELGRPPDFDGIRCRDCGNSFRTEWDHVRPRAAHGPGEHHEPRTALLEMSSGEDGPGPEGRKAETPLTR